MKLPCVLKRISSRGLQWTKKKLPLPLPLQEEPHDDEEQSTREFLLEGRGGGGKSARGGGFEKKKTAWEEEQVMPPKGCMAVYVGDERRRFVIPASYLNLPAFQEVMDSVVAEFGFGQAGGLRIPYEADAFEDFLRICRKSEKKSRSRRSNSTRLNPGR